MFKSPKKSSFNKSSVNSHRGLNSRPQFGNDRNSRFTGQNQGKSQTFKNPKPKKVPKAMEIDYNILVKKATATKIEDYKSKNKFDSFGLDSHIVKNLNEKGYIQPTEIQDKAIPVIMQKKNIIGIANTGTGKTAAFLLPLVSQVYENNKKCVLILAPTRELVSQILSELKSFVNNSNVSSVMIIGGQNIEKQIDNLKKKKNFIVATTGRGLDLIKQGYIKIKEVDTIVLDEMDQMLDMGFIKDIKEILRYAINANHLLFFSATMNKNIEKIASEIIKNAQLVSVSNGTSTDNVEQNVIEYTENENKFDILCELLKKDEVNKTIIFENTKHGATKIEKELLKRGFNAIAIHGNKNQNQRIRALDAFKTDKVNILIATNVAARGLDIPLVSHVINFSLPESKEDYIHRIGRTGRAGELGSAYTFVPIKTKIQ